MMLHLSAGSHRQRYGRNCRSTAAGWIHPSIHRFACASWHASCCSAALLATGCAGSQSALDPRGPVAEVIAKTWWLMFAGATVVLLLVMLLVLRAMFGIPMRPRGCLLRFLIGGGLVLPALT